MDLRMRRPRIKPEHQPFRYGDGRIRIGGVVDGIAADIEPADEWVWELLKKLDGTRTVDRIAAELVYLFPERSENEIHEAIGDLIHAGYVEDADELVPDGLTDQDRQRYGSSRALSRWMDRTARRTSWDTQRLLGDASVVVAGVGGAGGVAALALTMSGVGRVHCVDPDVVTLSNLNRQLLATEHDLGWPKVDVAVNRLRAHNSGSRITGDRLTIAGPESVRALAAGCDVVLLAADQPREIRSWTNQACLATNRPWVFAGYHGPRITIGVYRPNAGPCYDCARIAGQERRAGLRIVPLSANSATRTHAANAVSANLAGLLAAHAVQSLITGVPRLRPNRQYRFNLVTMAADTVDGPESPRPDCPACGSARG